MASVFPVDRTMKVSNANNGNILALGTAGVMQHVGMFSIQFQPSMDFVGGIVVMGHVMDTEAPAKMPLPPYVAYPYKAAYLNGQIPAQPFTFQLDAGTGLPPVINGPSIIQVPSNGVSIGLLVNCTAGSMAIYLQRLNGSSAV